jgi:hypothetical protein
MKSGGSEVPYLNPQLALWEHSFGHRRLAMQVATPRAAHRHRDELVESSTNPALSPNLERPYSRTLDLVSWFLLVAKQLHGPRFCRDATLFGMVAH